MKRLAAYCLLSLLATTAYSQYYLRGEIKDEKNRPLSNARIFLHSGKSYFFSGASSGGFGINTKQLNDSLTITLEGYETKTVAVKSNQWQTILLKLSADAVSKNQPKLISFTKDLNKKDNSHWIESEETYFQLIENDFVLAATYPNTGYSLNVNKASYSNVRRFLNMNSLVPPDAVRTEELINYFNLGYQAPEKNNLFNVGSAITACPWNSKEKLLFVNVSAKKLDFEKVPPGNFVFLIDVSGSMDMPNRLPLLKAAFQLFVKNLRPVDTVSIVTYGGYVQIWLKPTSGSEKEKILTAIEELEAAGDTPGESAIRIAYQVARNSFIKGGNNRIILATDGDFNVGQTSEAALDDMISKQRQSGVYLTCLGVGMGNFKDSKLQTLAKKGNGNYAYLDDIREAERVLVTELTQTFYSVADDVFMNVTFNPSQVQSYRLIGFDNKKEALKDSSNYLEGGEIGSGSNVMALFEILPTTTIADSIKQTMATLDLKYKLHQDSTAGVKQIRYQVSSSLVTADSAQKSLSFATAVAMFALKLKQSPYMKNQSWLDIQKLAKSSADTSNHLQKEFLLLIEKAIKLYGDKKKRRRD